MATAIPSEFAQFVKDEIASGKYRSPEEVLYEALRLLQTRERKLRSLKADLQVGLDQLDRGECQPLDMDAIRAEVRKRVSKKGRKP